ncbi:hypothetical protein EDB86DRAFT_2832297 [Lactarius hatsudake]|nr:hypothetical protein EDB86DRAFT_2832297 [Lactarius hatsudake]
MCASHGYCISSVAEVRSGTSVRTRTPEPNGNVPFRFRFWFNAVASGPVPCSGVAWDVLNAFERPSPTTGSINQHYYRFGSRHSHDVAMPDLQRVPRRVPTNIAESSPVQIIGAEQPSLAAPDMIPEYANGCNADLTSTSTVCFEDYADPTRHEECHICGDYTGFRKGACLLGWHPDLEQFHPNALVELRDGRRNALESRRVLIVGQMSSHILFGENTHTYLQLGTTLTSSGLRKNDVCCMPFCSVAIYCGLVDIKYSGLSDMPVSDNDEQCALRPDGTLKDASEIPWLNDPDDTEPISAHGLGAPSLNLDSDTSMTAGLKGKEPAQLVGSRRAIKPTAKAQQASLTRFFSTRTVLVDGKESVQTSSANSANSGPSKQGGSTPTAGKGTQKCTKASVSAGPKKCIKTTTGNQDVESDTNDDQDFTIGDGEARGSDGGDDTEEEGGYEQMRKDADQDRKLYR